MKNISSFVLISIIRLINRYHSKFISSSPNYHIPVSYQDAKPGDCGIACVAMILKWKHINVGSFGTFVSKHKTEENYLEPIGWRHLAMVQILREYHIRSSYHKYKTLSFLLSELKKGHPTIISVRVPTVDTISPNRLYKGVNNVEYTGHLCVVKGYENGYFIINDPRNVYKYAESVKVSPTVLSDIFTGNCIVVQEGN